MAFPYDQNPDQARYEQQIADRDYYTAQAAQANDALTAQFNQKYADAQAQLTQQYADANVKIASQTAALQTQATQLAEKADIVSKADATNTAVVNAFNAQSRETAIAAANSVTLPNGPIATQPVATGPSALTYALLGLGCYFFFIKKGF